jgi:hypothetical protein
VYSFLGAKEFYVPFEETINKMISAKQRIQENVSRQRKLLKTSDGVATHPFSKLVLWSSICQCSPAS